MGSIAPAWKEVCYAHVFPCTCIYMFVFMYRMSLEACSMYMYTSVKIIKNEVGCRDDTMPKTVDTRRHCEEE